MKIKNLKIYISFFVALATFGSLAGYLLTPVPAFAQVGGRGGMMPGIVGTVSAINGNTITVLGRQGFSRGVGKNTATSATTFTVDATNAKVTKNNSASTVSSIAVGDTISAQGTVSGTNVTATNIRDGVMMGNGVKNGMGVVGTVSAINGTTLTVNSKARPNGGTATTYTVNASGATVIKNGAASSVLNIAVGDTVIVQGTVSGTSVTAKTIRDGVAQPVIQGNGQPVVAGSVTAISGNTITITNKSNVTYSVDATNAKFVVPGITNPTISNVASGDNLVVQGTVNGLNVTASSVIDQKTSVNNGSGDSNSSNQKPKGFMDGMMSGISNFFKHLFGF